MEARSRKRQRTRAWRPAPVSAGACGAVPPGAAFFSGDSEWGRLQHFGEHGSLRTRLARGRRRGRHDRTGRPRADAARGIPERRQRVRQGAGKRRTGTGPERRYGHRLRGGNSASPWGPQRDLVVPKGIATEILAAAGARAGSPRFPRSTTPSPPRLRSQKSRSSSAQKVDLPGRRLGERRDPGHLRPGLQFVPRWPAELVSEKQTDEELRPLLFACDTCTLEVIRTRCSPPRHVW